MASSMNQMLFLLVFFNAVSFLVTQLSLPAGNEKTQSQMLDTFQLFELERDICKHHHLKLDTACLQINSTVDFKIDVYGQSSECYECEMMYLVSVKPYKQKAITVNTTWDTLFEVQEHNSSIKICSQRYHFDMSGIYMMFVNPMGYIDDISPEKIKDEKDASFFCNIIVVEDPVDIYLPIYIAIGVYVGLIILYVFGRYAHKHHWLYKVLFCLETERLVNSDLGSPNSILNASNSESQEQFPKKTEKQKPRRLKSLDTFRGISVVIMIFVNLGGGEYWFFHHSRWNGLTVADLVFPWFVFIMGTSIALAFHSLSIKGFSKKKMFIKICKRSAILFILGLILNTGKDRNGVDLNHIRIPGVLQRFSVCYFVVAIVEMLSVKKDDPYKYKYYAPIRDFVYLWIHWLVAICVVTLYLCLTFVLPIPDCPTGYQGPGGSLLHTDNDTDLYNCTGGAAGHIDKSVFGINHIYPHPTCLVLYQTGPYDPEGILGCLPAIFITFLGLLAGKILIFYTDWKQRVKRWLLWAILTGMIAGILCNFNKNDGWIPINKNLWSLSYVLALAATSFVLLIVCYILVDVYNHWSGSPFFQAGMNPIILYCGHEIMRSYFPWQWKTGQTHGENLAADLVGTTLWVLIALYLHHRQIYLKI